MMNTRLKPPSSHRRLRHSGAAPKATSPPFVMSELSMSQQNQQILHASPDLLSHHSGAAQNHAPPSCPVVDSRQASPGIHRRKFLTASTSAMVAAWAMRIDRPGPSRADVWHPSPLLNIGGPSSPSSQAFGSQKASAVIVTDDSGCSERAFNSISEALEAAGPGARVRVPAGTYRERLVLTRPVTVEAFPEVGVVDPEGSDVEVVWETNDPYQHIVEINYQPDQGKGQRQVELKGLRIRHYSKSVADNYGIYICAGSPLLNMCDISSRSGSGVGIEGALRPSLVQCHIHGCERHGIAVFGSIESPLDSINPLLIDVPSSSSSAVVDYNQTTTSPILQSCEIDGNKLDGVLARAGADVRMASCLVHDNGEFGINLQDAGGQLNDNVLSGNKKGDVAIRSAALDLQVKPEDLRAANSIKGKILLQ